MRDNKEICSFTKQLVLEASELVSKARDTEELSIHMKTEHDLVTSADLATEKFLISRIKARFPDDQILAEESAPILQERNSMLGPLWVIDPIDGTTNFARKQPQVAISVAYADGGEVQTAVVHAPFQAETFTAQRGGGAFMNDTPIRTSCREDLTQSLVGCGRPCGGNSVDQFLQQLQVVLSNCLGMRRFGAGALDICWVACGRLDAFYESLQPWDIAAAALIAKEAGARVGHIYGYPEDTPLPLELYSEQLLVATPALYTQLSDLLKV